MVSKASILGILLLLSATALHAGTIPTSQIKSLTGAYTVRSWTMMRGLPETEVRGLVFGPDGFLWLVTPHQLCRFDGVRFDSPLPEPGDQSPEMVFNGLFFDRQGTLWVYGVGGAWFYGPAGWQPLFTAVNKPGGEIRRLFQTSDGMIWLLVPGGLHAWDGRTLRFYPLPADLPPSVRLASMTIDSRGEIWLAASDRVLRFRQGRYQPCPLPKLPPSGPPDRPPGIWYIHAGPSGRVWTATHLELFVWENQTWRNVPSRVFDGHYTLPGECLETASGDLWVAGRESLSLLQRGQWRQSYNEKELDFPLICRTITEDSEGNIWVGTDCGLVRLSPRLTEVVPVTPAETTASRVSTVTMQENRELLAGFQGAQIAKGTTEGLKSLVSFKGLPHISAAALLRDTAGYLWIGSQGEYLWRVMDGKTVWLAGFRQGEKPLAYRTTTLRQTGEILWAGTNDGLMLCRDPHGRANFVSGGGPAVPVMALHEDRDGSLWIGYESNGLARRAPDGKFQLFHESDGLPGPGVYAIWKDADGVLWLGGQHGLARWEGDKHWVVPAECGFGGIPVTQIVEDDQQRLWLGTPDGIWRLSRRELAEAASGKRGHLHARRLGVDEGMPKAECTGSFAYAGVAPPKDRLWFGTAGGLVSFEPRNIPPAGHHPEVRLESITVSGKEIWRETLFSRSETMTPGELILAPGARQVKIAFTGFHYSAPDQLRFSYRLSGQQAGAWSPLSRDRMAQFEYLPAGRHALQIVACSPDGAWNEAGLEMVLNVKPWFWQTGWFFFGALLGAGIVTGLGVRMVIRRRWKARLHRMEKEMAVQQERSRIARDIHDELGAGLSEVTLLGELVQRPDAHPGRTQERLRRLFQRAGELTRSVDEIVWAINPTNDNLRSFVAYIIEYSREFLALASIPCRLNIPDVLPPMPINANVRHELCMVIKECLSNIVKHAGATEVSIGMNLEGRRLTICIEDNGRGFDPSRIDCDAGHDGLVNMRRRMEKLGSECRIDSESGKGTRVRLWYDVGALCK